MKLTTIAKQVLGRQTPNAINEGQVLKGMVDGKPTYIIEHDGQELRVSEKDWKAFKDMISLKESVVTEAKFNYMQDSDEVKDIFKKITGKSGNDDLDSQSFEEDGKKGWVLNVDDTNISTREKSMFVDAVMKLGKKKGWNIQQYGDDAIEIYESVNESIKEGTMSDIDMLAQEASTIEDFIKGFMADYGDKFVGASKPKLDKWLTDLYTDAKS